MTNTADESGDRAVPGLIQDQRFYFLAGKFGAAVEEGEFDQEGNFDDLGAGFFYEVDGCSGGAASGEEVIDENYFFSGSERVNVDGDGVGAVFEVVGFFLAFLRFPRKSSLPAA